MTEKQDSETIDVTTAFIVFHQPGQGWMASNDFSRAMKLERVCTPDDMYEGCGTVRKDILVQETAAHTVLALDRKAQQAMQQMENYRVMSELNGGSKSGGGLIVP